MNPGRHGLWTLALVLALAGCIGDGAVEDEAAGMGTWQEGDAWLDDGSAEACSVPIEDVWMPEPPAAEQCSAATEDEPEGDVPEDGHSLGACTCWAINRLAGWMYGGTSRWSCGAAWTYAYNRCWNRSSIGRCELLRCE
jgi:hypothetical protein